MDKIVTIILFLVFFLPFGNAYQIDLNKIYTLEELQDKLITARNENNSKDLADIYFLTAKIQEKEKFNTELALELYIRAQQYYIKIGDQNKNHEINKYLANRYFLSGFLQESLELYQQILQYYNDADLTKEETEIHYLMSKVYRTKGDTELSLKHLNQAITLNNFVNDSTLLVDYSLDKVRTYIELSELDSALITSTICFDISSDLDNRAQMSKSLTYIGYINFIQKDYPRSIKYLEKSKELLPNLPYDQNRRKLYSLLADAYAQNNQYENSYTYAQKYIVLNDSILNHDRITSINNLSIKHQSQEKSKEIEILEIEKKSALRLNKMQRNILYFVAAGFGLLLIALYLIIRFYNQKIRNETIINEQKHKIDQQKIKELEDTMQINNMQSMIVGQEKERERIAKDLHDSLGGLLSTVKLKFDQVRNQLTSQDAGSQYNKAAKLLDTAVEEVRVISRNLQPGALKKLGLIPAIKDLINRFDSEEYPDIYFQHYNLPQRLDEMKALNVYRIIQEMLTNSIKYAEAGEILIQLNQEGNDLYLQYEDDGIGFQVNEPKSRGMGLENIQSRIKYLKGQISLESEPNEGVSFLIKIPNEIKE